MNLRCLLLTARSDNSALKLLRCVLPRRLQSRLGQAMAARCACAFMTCESSCQVADICVTSCVGSSDLARVLLLARQMAASHAQQRLNPAAPEPSPNRTRNSSCRTACLLQEQKQETQQVKRQLSQVKASTVSETEFRRREPQCTDSEPHTKQRQLSVPSNQSVSAIIWANIRDLTYLAACTRLICVCICRLFLTRPSTGKKTADSSCIAHSDRIHGGTAPHREDQRHQEQRKAFGRFAERCAEHTAVHVALYASALFHVRSALTGPGKDSSMMEMILRTSGLATLRDQATLFVLSASEQATSMPPIVAALSKSSLPAVQQADLPMVREM